MMYEKLADYYDALVSDEEATLAWCDLIEHYVKGKEVLELACGSGEITCELAKRGYHMFASDISESMLEKTRAKNVYGMELACLDMRKFELNRKFDAILCLCDSFNYILKDEDVESMFDCVVNHLNDDGYFIVDMHTRDRLDEFVEEYNEAGSVMGCEYQWCITSENDRVYQNFAFYDEQGKVILEQHEQRVYDPQWIIKQLEKRGFVIEIKTDFELEGIQSGEKWFFIARKVK